MKTKSNVKKPAKAVSGPSAGPPKLSKRVEEELLHFIEFHSAHRLSRNLRNLLVEFLMYDGGTDAVYLRDLLSDLLGLYDLLDCIEAEQQAVNEVQRE